MKKPIWINEETAANMMGYKPEVFRRYVKAGKLNVAYSTINNRKFRYNQVDIEKELLQHSTFIG